MIQLPKNRNRTSFRQLGLFVLTGGMAAIVNVLSRLFLSRLVRFELAVLVAYAIGMITAYLLARRFVFVRSQLSWRRSFAAFALVNLVAVMQTWLVSIWMRQLLLPVIGLTVLAELIAHCCGVIMPVFTSFVGHKYLSFPEPRSSPSAKISI